jgi:hypothetical protein
MGYMNVTKFIRLCPLCKKELTYSSSASLGLANRKNGKCSSCSKQGKISNNRGKPFGSLYYLIKFHASKYRNIECLLTYEDFLEFTKIDKCYYCGDKIIWNCYQTKNGRGRSNLDRKNNTKGYSKDNCVVCCESCNYMKNTMPVDKFIQQCKNITEYQGIQFK